MNKYNLQNEVGAFAPIELSAWELIGDLEMYEEEKIEWLFK